MVTLLGKLKYSMICHAKVHNYIYHFWCRYKSGLFLTQTSLYLEGNLVGKTSPISEDTVKPVYSTILALIYGTLIIGTQDSNYLICSSTWNK